MYHYSFCTLNVSLQFLYTKYIITVSVHQQHNKTITTVSTITISYQSTHNYNRQHYNH